MEYSIKFGVHNFIFNAIWRIIVYIPLRRMLVNAYHNGAISGFEWNFLELVIKEIIFIIIIICSVSSSAKFVGKRCGIPDKHIVKKFAIIYYGSFVLIQGLETLLTVKSNWVYLKYAGEWIGENVAQEYMMARAEDITSIAMLICILCMIPYVIKKYDKY